MAHGALKKKLDRMESHGWFTLPGHPGDRTLEQQLTGLEQLILEVKGKTVLDVGCAEGLVGITCAKAGALSTHGIEIVHKHVVFAVGYKGDLPCTFEKADANEYVPRQQYDIVLMLAVLHKLKNPTEACIRFAKAAKNLCIIRMGADKAEIIVDARSLYVPHFIGVTMREQGFVMERMERGPYNECTWYYRRRK